MRIGVNALSAVTSAGVTYLTNIVENFAQIDKSNHYYIYVTPKNKSIFNIKNDNMKIVVCHYARKSVYHRIIWEQLAFPKLLKKQHIDVLFCPANIMPLFSACKSVVTIHNMEPFSPELIKTRRGISRVRNVALRILTGFSMTHAAQIIALSQGSKDKLVKRFPSSADRICVIHYGISRIFTPKDKIESKLYCAEKFGIRQDFILSVSKIDPPKNFVRLIIAFSKLKKKIKSGIQLAIAGPNVNQQYYTQMLNIIKANRIEQDVLLLGEVPHAELPYLYSGAEIYVFPSIYENSATTPVEAMASGVPVVASDIEATVEACGDSAIYFDPLDVDDMVSAMLRVLSSPQLKEALIKSELERVKQFSWEYAAMQTLAVYEEVYK